VIRLSFCEMWSIKTVTMKTAALCDMTLCSLVKCTNISDDPVASIITEESSEMLGHSYQTTWHHIPNAFRWWAHKAHDLMLHTTNTLT
jgi:hypothetical protein